MIEKIAGTYGVDTAAKVKAKKLSVDGVNYESDKANFSSFAVELARISGELKNVQDVRQDIVDDFKKQVEKGEYHPPLEKIAYNLFMAGILNDKE